MKKKRRFQFKSIYVKFTVIFLSIWWLLNSMSFGVVMHVMTRTRILDFSFKSMELSEEFFRIRLATGLAFLASACIGTIAIILVVRGIVKPIKQLSNASKEVARGNFDIFVRPRSADEVGRLTEDFNTMVKELKSIDVLRKEFVTNVSHEFRTPITSISGFAKLIRDAELPDEQRFEYSNIIINESERLIALSSNLLQLSELESHVIREQSTRFFLDEQIRKAILILEPLWTKKNIEFDLDLETTVYVGDENLLRQVFLNVIQNAIKFSYDHGLIRVSVHSQYHAHVIVIADNGVGIESEDKSRIFDRFYKADKSRSKDGHGLGLVIVKKIVDTIGGNIYVESEVGSGSTFTIELPL